jgi:hypothetical protein
MPRLNAFRRFVMVLIAVALLAGAALFARSPKATSLLTAAGLTKPVDEAETITVTPGTLTFRVETAGTLRAT